MVKVKICGITNLADAEAAIEAGCAALGFVFYRKSSRYIDPNKAQKIINNIPRHIIKIGVFVNAREKSVKRIARLCNLDILQFHGDESWAFCEKFKNYKIIKAFRVKDKIDPSHILKYRTFAYLFDTFVKSMPGGTGRSFDWRLLKSLGPIKQPIFLSGGISENNVRQAIGSIRPQWIDVSSSLEIRPGKKSRKKIENFMKLAKKL